MKLVYGGELISIKKMPCFDMITERTSMNMPKGKSMLIQYAVDKKGDYLGSVKTAYRLVYKYGISIFEKTDPKHCVCSIGYNLSKKVWYGWSHRAIYSFKTKRQATAFAKSVS